MSTSLLEPAREIPVLAEADVVVCGGGPGGLSAAIAAARSGARTLLIERYGYLGGMATAGLVAPILGLTAVSSKRPIVMGLLKELIDQMHLLGGAPAFEQCCEDECVHFEAEALKRAADVMVLGAKVKLLFHTLVVDCISEGSRIEAIIVENKSGRGAVKAKLFIDATGDADLAFRAGAPTKMGRDFDGEVQSIGSFLHLGNMPKLSEEAQAQAWAQVSQAALAGRFKIFYPSLFDHNTHLQDYEALNMARAKVVNPLDAKDLTRAELDIRDNFWKYAQFLREEVPGFEDVYVRATSPQAGVRESRQIVGQYALTGDDVLAGRKFDDAIARGSWFIDIHCPYGRTYPIHFCFDGCPAGDTCRFLKANHQKFPATKEGLFPPPGDWYDIPYRCLIPGKVENLLVSGRCISATHEGMSSARVMGTCMAIGQAAGTAAAICLKTDVIPADLDAAILRTALQEAGALV